MSSDFIPNPGIRIDGKLNNPKAATRKNLSTDMKVGRQNVFDYTDSTVSDGSTDARAAILAADAVGPVILPPGTYAIASNMTLSNKITFDPGAKLKPANGITVTLDSGYIAEDTQHVFDISAGGSVVVEKMDYITPQHFGANGSNDTAAFRASVATSINKCTLSLPPQSIDLTDLASIVSITGNFSMVGSGTKSLITGPSLTDGFLSAANTSGASISLSNLKVVDFLRVLSLDSNLTETPYGDIHLSNCSCNNLGNGLFGTGNGVFFDANSIAINDCQLTNVGKDTSAITVSAIKIAARNIKSVKIDGVYIDGVASLSHTGEAVGVDVRMSGSTDKRQPTSISNCTIKNIVSATSTGTDQVAGIVVLGGIANISNNMLDTIVADSHPTSPDGIWTESQHSVIAGNTILDVEATEGAINCKNDGLGTEYSSERSLIDGNMILLRGYISTATKLCRAIKLGSTNIVCSNNIIDRYPTGITIGYGLCVVQGNIITRAGCTNATEVYGILHVPASGSPAASTVIISDNSFIELGQDAATNAYGIQFNLISAEDVNSILATGNRFINFSGSSPSIAIALNHTSSVALDQYVVKDNYLQGINTGVWTNGTGTIDEFVFRENNFLDVTTKYVNSTLVVTSYDTSPTITVESNGSLGSGTQVFNFDNLKGHFQSVTATGAIALQFVATKAGYYTAVIAMDGTGGHTITYATTVKGTAPTINTTANEKTIIPLFYDGATWFHV